jgi:hypothetical protein
MDVTKSIAIFVRTQITFMPSLVKNLDANSLRLALNT